MRGDCAVYATESAGLLAIWTFRAGRCILRSSPVRRHMRRALRGGRKTAHVGATAFILLAGGVRLALAQDGVVAGVVLAERSLRPVAGAQIVAEDTTLRTVTDAIGRFRLVGLAGAEITLAVRRIGYQPLRRTVPVGDTTLRFLLADVAIELDGVIVTGTPGETARRALGNAVTSISASELVEGGTVSSMQQLLNGRAPGVVVQPASGMVGAGARLSVRGGASFGLANEPLLYVDGVRANNTTGTGPLSQGFGSSPISRLNDLSPDEIERVEIIKGPAAATLYGTEASTGVINVITKQGTVGPARWRVGIKRGVNYLRDPEGRFPTNYQRDSAGNIIAIDIVERENERGTPIFRRGAHDEYDLSVSGGSQQFRYALAGAYRSSDGVEPLNELRKYSGRLNATLVPSDRLTLVAGVGYTRGPTRLATEGAVGGRVSTTIFADPRKLPGGGGDSTRRGFHGALPEEYDLLASHGGKAELMIDRLTTTLRVAHRPLAWLSQRLSAGFDRTGHTNTTFLPRVDALIANPPFPSWPRGMKEVAVRDIRYQTIDYAVTAAVHVTPVVRSSTSLGGQYYRNVRSFLLSSGQEFPAEGLSSISSTTGMRNNQEDLLEDATLGIYAQQEVAWRDRLFVTAALRADDHSAFGANFDRMYYPKAGLSWVLSEEPFVGRVPWVKTFRFRAAYGEAGKQPPTFDALPTYEAVFGPADAPAVTPLSIGNPDLGPERGKELEVGFDAALLGDRLGVEVTYYHKRTVGGILQREVAPSGGYPGVQLFNAGEIRNTGIELLTRALPLRGAGWGWDVTFTLATNANRVVNLTDAGLEFVAAGTYQRHQVGYPVGSWFEKRVVTATMTETGAVSNVMCDDRKGGSTPCAGPDGTYGNADDAPAVYLGRPLPKVEGAIANTLTLLSRRLRLYALVDFKTGHRKLDFNTLSRCSNFGGRCRENFFPTEFDPRRIAAVNSNRNLVDFVIVDAGFAKLRELSATYVFPDRWAAIARASRASVSLAGRELHTWTRYRGLETEAMYLGGTRGGNYGNWEQAMLPQLSQWLVAVNLGY